MRGFGWDWLVFKCEGLERLNCYTERVMSDFVETLGDGSQEDTAYLSRLINPNYVWSIDRVGFGIEKYMHKKNLRDGYQVAKFTPATGRITRPHEMHTYVDESILVFNDHLVIIINKVARDYPMCQFTGIVNERVFEFDHLKIILAPVSTMVFKMTRPSFVNEYSMVSPDFARDFVVCPVTSNPRDVLSEALMIASSVPISTEIYYKGL